MEVALGIIIGILLSILVVLFESVFYKKTGHRIIDTTPKPKGAILEEDKTEEALQEIVEKDNSYG